MRPLRSHLRTDPSVVQALVFSMLSTIYFLLMLPHEHGAAHGEAAQHPVP